MTKRAAIYARFSSEQQNEKSCRDQIDLCDNWASSNDIEIVGSFQDDAVSGASTINRPGLSNLMRSARLARFDVILCEDLDRLSRSQADLHRIRDELKFLGVSIMTVSDGAITAMHAGLKGLMSEMFLTDLANKTRRGLRGRVTAGASGGGKSYGYDVVPGKPGEHVINEREAEMVRRIFADYVAGKTPREIASDLNREGVRGPRGGAWNSSTLNGSKSRANGVLQNRLYIGEIVWNRQRFIKDPATGKRVSRLNLESEWVVAQAPHLAIIDAEVFAQSIARKASRTFDKAPVPAKPRHLLSGMVKCGWCGRSYTVIGADRMGCTGFRDQGTCDNNRTVARTHVERRVLRALQTQLSSPELIEAYVQEFHARLQQRMNEIRSGRDKLERRQAEVIRSITRIVDQVADGTASKALMIRLTELEAELQSIADQIAETEQDAPKVSFHPSAAQKYKRIVEELQASISTQTDEKVIEAARKLIDKVVIYPRESKEPVDLVVHGLLAELLIGPTGTPEVRGALVAGTRNNRTPNLCATFVLAA